jgi:broad specificity phosphatase PhoE
VLSTRRLILWRHGQTIWNVEKRFQGQSDIPLDETGERQAERAARLLAALQPDVIVSSDLRRATGTAAQLSRITGLPVTADKDLRERYGGLWEGLTDREIRDRYPEAHASWTPPEGESSEAVGERVSAALERVAVGLPDDGLAVVVSHGAAIRLGMSRLLGIPQELWGVLGPVSNCAWSLIGMGRTSWRVLEHNAGTLPEPVMGDDR